MHWITLTLIAHFLWAITNTGDKLVVEHGFKNGYAYIILVRLLTIPVVLLIPFFGLPMPMGWDMVLIALGAFGFFIGSFPYIVALQHEEVSRVNVLWAFNPMYAVLLELIFFGTVLSGLQFLAFAILVLATVLASVHISETGRTFRYSKAVPLMLLGTFFFASYGVIIGKLGARLPFETVVTWAVTWMVIYALIGTALFPSIRQSLREEGRRLSRPMWLFIIAVNVAAYVGIVVNQKALTLAPASLVFSLEGSQSLFVFCIVIVLGLWNKELLKEELDRKNIALKLAAVLLMAIGIAILSVG